jgi:hypothetical protein
MRAKPSIPDSLLQLGRKFRWSNSYYGIGLSTMGTLVKAVSTLNSRSPLIDWYKKAMERSFDQRFGVETSGRVSLKELGITKNQQASAVPYQATLGVTFGVVLSQLKIKYQDYVFVDYGSGKGATLIKAAFFPFKAIVGVEVSSSLSRIAEKNIKSLRGEGLRCLNIKSVCEDAALYNPPDDPLVAYFYHPFGESVLKKVLECMRRSLERNSRHVVIVYQGPVYRPGFEERNAEARYVLSHKLKAVFEETDFLRKVPFTFGYRGWEIYETNFNRSERK